MLMDISRWENGFSSILKDEVYGVRLWFAVPFNANQSIQVSSLYFVVIHSVYFIKIQFQLTSVLLDKRDPHQLILFTSTAFMKSQQ